MISNETPVERIVIVGTSGCGKTTLAKQLSVLTGSPFTDLDDIYWLPEWIPLTDEEMFSRVKELAETDRWIIAGNYSRGSHLTWPKADLIVWLDFPLPILIWRAMKRSIQRIFTKEPCCNGNYETVGRLFSRHSILSWILSSYGRRKKTYSKYLNDPNHHHFVRISTRAEKERLVAEIEKNQYRPKLNNPA